MVNNRVLLALASTGVALMMSGCQSSGSCCVANNSEAAIAKADAARAQLSRLVGAWDLDGWWKGNGNDRNTVHGRAAGVLENQYFVLMDVQTTSGEMAGRTARKSGSFLFASEPGIGLTASAWGDASPSISRFVGTAQGNGIVFKPAHNAYPNAELVLTFESDNRFTAEVVQGSDVHASYTFTRSAAK
ncbi:MAG: hypothetical protein JSS51_00545 [Planctomycetes bacterium]|nr:hypothetical protein [Planctomycetota bacterium]